MTSSSRSPAARETHTPTAPEAEVRAEKAAAREVLALEFADLDDDADTIWIDLEGIFDEPANALPLVPAGHEETEPVAFFAVDDDADSPLSRKSGPGLGLRASVVDEETKPVPPPEP